MNLVVANRYHTDDLTHWPQLRRFEPTFLSHIDRFHLYGFGARLLLITHDDRVYRSHATDQHQSEWSKLVEFSKLSGKRVMSVLDFRGGSMVALTLDGKLLMWLEPSDHLEWNKQEMAPPQLLVNNVKMMAKTVNSLHVLSRQGTVLMLDFTRFTIGQVEELSPYGPVVSIDGCRSKLVCLTTTGQCLLLIITKNGPSRVVELSIPPGPMVESVVTTNHLFILSLDGQVFRFHNNQCQSANRTLPVPKLVSKLSEPIRHIHRCRDENEVVFEAHSGRLYQSSAQWSSCPFTSATDLCSYLSRHRETLDLTGITWSKAQSTSLSSFNYPRNSVLSLGFFNPISDNDDEDQGQDMASHTLYLASIWSEIFPERSPCDQLRLPVPYTSNNQAWTTTYAYFRFLFDPSPPTDLGFGLLSFPLYLYSLLLDDHRMQKLTLPLVTRVLSRLYRLDQPDLYRSYLDSIYYPSFLYSYTVGFVDRTKPEGTLAQRLIRHLFDRHHHSVGSKVG